MYIGINEKSLEESLEKTTGAMPARFFGGILSIIPGGSLWDSGMPNAVS